MATQWFIADFLTGEIIHEFEPSAGAWEFAVNAGNVVSVEVDVRPADERDWRNLSTWWKHMLIVEVDGRLCGGPIMPHDYAPGSPLKFSTGGLWAYWKHRTVSNASYWAQSPVDAFGNPQAAFNVSFKGYDLGSIGRLLVENSRRVPGGAFPIVFDREVTVGRHERNYKAVEFTTMESALSNLYAVEGGPDVAFDLEWADASRSRVRWRMRTGSEAVPRLGSRDAMVWDAGAQITTVSEMSMTADPNNMCSRSWFVSGRSEDKVMVAMSTDDTLLRSGFPMLELLDTSHSSVTIQGTLDGYAREAVRTGSRPAEFISFTASMDEPPFFREYQVGDKMILRMEGDPYWPNGEYVRRILKLSGDAKARTVKVETGEWYG